MRKMMIRSTVALSLLALPMAGMALAQSSAPAATPATGTATPMSMTQVIDHLSGQGYKDIRDVERKGDKLYEIKATTADGQRQELLIDARSGEILKAERD